MIKLKIARIKLGWTQEELSFRAEVARTTISQLESGKVSYLNVRVSTLKKIAIALNTSVQELFFNEEEI